MPGPNLGITISRQSDDRMARLIFQAVSGLKDHATGTDAGGPAGQCRKSCRKGAESYIRWTWSVWLATATLRRGLQVGAWIDGPAVTQHLKMKVRAGGAAGRAHQRHALTFGYTIANPHQNRLAVRVAGGIAVPMVDFDGATVAIFVAGKTYYTAAHGLDLRAETAGDVHTLVVGGKARERGGNAPRARGTATTQ